MSNQERINSSVIETRRCFKKPLLTIMLLSLIISCQAFPPTPTRQPLRLPTDIPPPRFIPRVRVGDTVDRFCLYENSSQAESRITLAPGKSSVNFRGVGLDYDPSGIPKITALNDNVVVGVPDQDGFYHPRFIYNEKVVSDEFDHRFKIEEPQQKGTNTVVLAKNCNTIN